MRSELYENPEKDICPICGAKVKDIALDIIFADKKPELREQVRSGEFFTFECPHCHCYPRLGGPLSYIDDTNKFYAVLAPIGELMCLYLDGMGDKSDYIHVGATDCFGFVSKILMLEKGLDHRYGELYLQALSLNRDEELENGIDLPTDEGVCYVDNAYFDIVNGEMKAVLKIKSDAMMNKACLEDYIFEEKLYDAVESHERSNIERATSFLFDREAAFKYIGESEDDECTKLENLLILQPDQGPSEFVLVPSCSESCYKIGDPVVAADNSYSYKGVVRKFFQMDRHHLPRKLEDIPTVLYKATRYDLIQSLPVGTQLINDDIRRMISKTKKNEVPSPKKLSKADVILPVNLNLGTSIGPKFVVDYIEEYEGNFLIVYLDNEDAEGDPSTPFIYKFDDVMQIVLRNPDQYDGIVINPDAERYIMTFDMLTRYRIYSVLHYKRDTIALLESLNDKEREYLGDIQYRLIYTAYTEDVNPKILSKRFKLKIADIDRYLNEGYSRLEKIVLSRQQNI